MKKRETAVLVLMGLALVYAAFSLLVESSPEQTSVEAEKELKRLESEVEIQKVQVLDVVLNDTEEYLIQSAVRGWETGTLARARQAVQISLEREGPVMKFSGYLEMETRKIAIINGSEYEVGETMDPEGFVVKRIDSAKVVLKAGDGGEEIIVPIEESFLP